MKTFLSLFAGALLMTATPACGQSHHHEDMVGKISVAGVGKSYQAPDVASVSAGVVTQAPTAQAAMSANSRKMNSVIDALKSAGIQSRHIQTSQLSLNPQYDYSNRKQPRITGYQARNTVSARSENLDQVGPMLDALIEAGANNINGIQFSIKDAEAAKSEARKEAVKNARRKAEEMATAAGVRLGKILQMSESGGHFNPPQPMMMRAMSADMAESTPVQGGEQTLAVTVNMVFAID